MFTIIYKILTIWFVVYTVNLLVQYEGFTRVMLSHHMSAGKFPTKMRRGFIKGLTLLGMPITYTHLHLLNLVMVLWGFVGAFKVSSYLFGTYIVFTYFMGFVRMGLFRIKLKAKRKLFIFTALVIFELFVTLTFLAFFILTWYV